jgi:hypothetical protein
VKSILKLIAFLVLGAGLTFGGISELTSDRVSCGSTSMSPGDICSVTSNGSSSELTYDEQKSNNQRTGYILVGLGGVFLLFGVGSIVGAVVRRGRATARI